ncbi:MAG: CidA/LrgA family protein [Candidatus Gastranaerophilaceae bacterium]
MMKNFFKFLLGFTILFIFYYLSFFIVKIFNIKFPAAVLGLILFALSLIIGIIKEEWIELSVNFLLKNMALLFVPFVVGLSVYKSFLMKNFIPILLVVLITTIFTIVFTGLLVEYGIKFVRLWKIKRGHHD